MGLTNREKLEIISRAKKDNYTGNYLDLFNQAAAEGRQKMPEVRRAGGFIYDVNKPDKSTYVDARSGYGFPTTYEHGGPHAEYPPYDSLTDFQKQNIRRDEYEYTTMEMGVDGREFVPGPGGTLDSLAMNQKSDEVQRLMTPYNVHMEMPRPDGSFGYQTNEEAEKEAQRLNQENPLDNFYSEPDNLYLQGRFEEDDHNFKRNKIDNSNYTVARETYDGKDIYYPGRSAENQSQNLAKLREGHEGIQPHPSNVFTPELRMKSLQSYKAYLMENEGDSERLAMINSEIANIESGNNPDYYELGKTSHNMIRPNKERRIEENINNINYYDVSNNGQPSNVPLYSEGTRIPSYNRPVGRPIPNKPVAVPPRIEPRAAGPIPTNFVEPELQKATMPEFPDTGPNKADLFFENLENANTFKNRPDKMSDRSARNVRGKDDVSSEYIFSDDNPYAPQKGEYFMSEANSRGKRKYDGDLNAARKWERENGLGIQTDLKGYDVGPDIQKHGGFSRMFKQDFSKYINKKYEHGGSHMPTVDLPEVEIFANPPGQRVADIASSMEMNEEDGGREPASFDKVKGVKGFGRYLQDLLTSNMDEEGLCRDNTCVDTVKKFYSKAGIDAIPGGVYNNREFLKNFKEYGFEEILDQKNLKPGDVIQYYYGEDSEGIDVNQELLNYPYHMGVYVSPGEYIGDGDSKAPIKRQNMFTGIDDMTGEEFQKDPFRSFRYIGKQNNK